MTAPAAGDVVRLTESSPEPLLRSWYELRLAVHRERQPDLPTAGYPEVLRLLATAADRPADTWAVVGDGAVLATCTRQLPPEPNAHVVRLDGAVRGDRRRSGLDRRLAAVALTDVPPGRTAVVANGVAGSAADHAAAALGMTSVLGAPRLVLDVRALDEVRLRAWATGDPAYGVVAWSGRCPDDIVEAFAAARQAMVDAPVAGSEQVRWTVADVRREEHEIARGGDRQHVVCLLHAPTGAVAAVTELTVLADRVTIARQGDTCVVPAHRGRRLGVRVKAEMLLRLRQVEPAVATVNTWNAVTNRHMLAVNHELGFVERETWAQYEGRLGVVRGRLGLSPG